MARSATLVSEEEVEQAVGEAQPVKRRRASGPRKERPIYILFRVVDDQGSPVPNAKVQVVLASKDTNAILEQKTDELSLAKVELPKSEQQSE